MLLKSRLLNEAFPIPFYQAPDAPAGGPAPADPPADAGASGTPPTGDSDGGGAPPADAGAGAAGEGGQPQEPPPKTYTERDIAWRDKEINKKHAQNKQKDDEIARLRAENERLKGQPAADATPPAAAPAPQRRDFANDVEFQAAVKAEADRQTAQRQFDTQAEQAYATGQKDYGEKWEPAVTQLRKLGGFDADTLSAVLATDNPSQVVFELGNNPAEFQRIMELPQNRRMVEFVKLALPKQATGKKVSDAPPPVDTIQGRGGVVDELAALNDYDKADKMSDAEWYRLRQKHKAQSAGRPWSLPAR